MAVITKDAGISRANINLVSGEVTALSFAKSYEYYAVRNDGANDFYISTEDSACTPNGDNVVCVKASDSYVHHNGLGKEGIVYFSGNGAVTVIGQDKDTNPFRNSVKGGVDKSDFDALSDDVEMLGARFDNAVAAITTDTELADIRVGADGTTYANAGTAVREQVSVLRQDLVEVEDIVGVYKPITNTAESSEANVAFTVLDGLTTTKLKNYKIRAFIENPIDRKVYLSFYRTDGSLGMSGNIAVGDTSVEVDYVASIDDTNAKVVAQVNYANIPVTVVFEELGEHGNNLTALENKVDSMESDFESIKENAVMKTSETPIDFADSDNGHYINYNGSYGTTSAFSISKPFDVEQDSVIKVKCKGANDQVAIIAKVNGTKYKPLVISIDSTEREYEYTANENMTVVISYMTSAIHEGVVIKPFDIENLFDDVNKINLNSRKWTYNLWKVLCIGDSLTSGANYDEEWVATGQGKSIDQNYPRILGRMLNAEVTNGGVSGSSASTWYENQLSKYNFADYDTFIIWLGTNNALDYETEETYYRNIIDAIQTANSSCLIVLVKIFATANGTVDGSNAIVDTIASEYGFPVIDNSDIGHVDRPDLHCNIANPHFGKAGNIVIADRVIEKLGDWFEQDHLRSEYGYSARTN